MRAKSKVLDDFSLTELSGEVMGGGEEQGQGHTGEGGPHMLCCDRAVMTLGKEGGQGHCPGLLVMFYFSIWEMNDGIF